MLAFWFISFAISLYQQVLVTNEFAVTSQLVGAPHPRAWKDSWRLAPNEVVFLLELGKRFVIGSVWVAFVCWYCYIGWKAMCRKEHAPDPLRRRRVLFILVIMFDTLILLSEVSSKCGRAVGHVEWEAYKLHCIKQRPAWSFEALRSAFQEQRTESKMDRRGTAWCHFRRLSGFGGISQEWSAMLSRICRFIQLIFMLCIITFAFSTCGCTYLQIA